MRNNIYRIKILTVALIFVLIAALLFDYGQDSLLNKLGKSQQQQDDTETKKEPPSSKPPNLNEDFDNNEAIWKVGNPSPLLPVVRGENKQRQYGTPITRELPNIIENSAPSIMAMTPADGRFHLLPEEIDLYTLKSRRMVLDTVALDRVIAGETNHIIAPTPGAEVLDLKITSIRTRSKQTHSFLGKIEGDELSDVILVYHDGIIHGTVARYSLNQHFEYRILPDGHMMVRELDAAAIPEGCANPGPSAEHTCDSHCKHEAAEQAEPPTTNPAPEAGSSEEGDTTGWTTIDVVVGYGSQARIADGGVSQIEARIIGEVDRMTNAFINSLVTNTELMLLGTIEDPNYVFPGANASDMGSIDELGDLDDFSDGNLDAVSNYSTLLGADLTSFICKESQGGTAGIAYRPGRSSIVSRTSMTSSAITFAHELGHNLGAKHSLGDGTNDNVLNTARYGLRTKTTAGVKYRTIMAYDEGWGGGRVPHYANPNVNYGDTPTGVNDGVNLTGNTFVDPYYAIAGFNGSNPSLGARNAQMFLVQNDGENGVVYASQRKTRTALNITSPVASVQWTAGSTQTISFTGGDMDYTADIDLYKGGVYQFTIANDMDAIDHSYTWNIPLAQEGGNNFKIRVTLSHPTNGTSYAESGEFIIHDTNDIIIDYPIGGESMIVNIQNRITWLSQMSGNVKIELLKNGSLNTTIANSTTNDGSFYWTPPSNQTVGNDYKIRVSKIEDPTRIAVSSTNFSIVAAPTASTIPYSESFETGFGAWTQSATDTMDWSRLNSPTASVDTGPDSASQGSWYLYTEASGYLNTTADLTSWFDLRSTASPSLTFYYHMFGNTMGTLRLQATMDGTNWVTLFTKSGTNQNLWKSQVVNLSAYAGKFLQLRFSGTTGSSWASDMAIDQISIVETSTTTYTVTYNANATITGNVPSSQTKGQGVNLTLADGGTMIRNGYTCTGWNTASNGSGTSYTLAGTYTGNSSLTLYAQWTFNAYQIWAGEGIPYLLDSNGDGIANGLAWLLGATNSMSPINNNVPTAASNSSNLILNFRCLNAAARGAAAINLQHSSDLGITDPWSSVVVPESSGTVSGVTFLITPNGVMNEIQATIPSSHANSGKIFSRLSTASP